MEAPSPDAAPAALTRRAPPDDDLLGALRARVVDLLTRRGERAEAVGDGADAGAVAGDAQGVLVRPRPAPCPPHRVLAPRRATTTVSRPEGAHAHHRAHEGADHRGQPAATHSVHVPTLRASLPEVSVE